MRLNKKSKRNYALLAGVLAVAGFSLFILPQYSSSWSQFLTTNGFPLSVYPFNLLGCDTITQVTTYYQDNTNDVQSTSTFFHPNLLSFVSKTGSTKNIDHFLIQPYITCSKPTVSISTGLRGSIIVEVDIIDANRNSIILTSQQLNDKHNGSPIILNYGVQTPFGSPLTVTTSQILSKMSAGDYPVTMTVTSKPSYTFAISYPKGNGLSPQVATSTTIDPISIPLRISNNNLSVTSASTSITNINGVSYSTYDLQACTAVQINTGLKNINGQCTTPQAVVPVSVPSVIPTTAKLYYSISYQGTNPSQGFSTSTTSQQLTKLDIYKQDGTYQYPLNSVQFDIIIKPNISTPALQIGSASVQVTGNVAVGSNQPKTANLDSTVVPLNIAPDSDGSFHIAQVTIPASTINSIINQSPTNEGKLTSVNIVTKGTFTAKYGSSTYTGIFQGLSLTFNVLYGNTGASAVSTTSGNSGCQQPNTSGNAINPNGLSPSSGQSFGCNQDLTVCTLDQYNSGYTDVNGVCTLSSTNAGSSNSIANQVGDAFFKFFNTALPTTTNTNTNTNTNTQQTCYVYDSNGNPIGSHICAVGETPTTPPKGTTSGISNPTILQSCNGGTCTSLYGSPTNPVTTTNGISGVCTNTIDPVSCFTQIVGSLSQTPITTLYLVVGLLVVIIVVILSRRRKPQYAY